MQYMRIATSIYITSSYSTLYELLRPGYGSTISKGIVLAIFITIARFRASGFTYGSY
jgi:hypothetical protein